MGAIAQEKDKGTAAMMLVKPLPRGSFIGAKFLGSGNNVCNRHRYLPELAAIITPMLLFEAMDILHWLVLNALFLFVYVW